MADLPQERDVSPEESDAIAASFKQAIANRDQQHYSLRLYIAGNTSRSARSLENLKLLCETYLQGRYELEVIDIYQDSSKIQRDYVVAVPTLVKELPLPIRRIIGDLSNTEKVLVGLDLIPR